MSIGIATEHPPLLGDDFYLMCHAKRTKKGPLNLTGARIYITFKDALTDADNVAALQKDSTTNPTYFSVTDATNGKFEVTVPGADMDGLTPDIDYYVDVQVITSGGALVTVVNDVVRFDQDVTRATT